MSRISPTAEVGADNILSVDVVVSAFMQLVKASLVGNGPNGAALCVLPKVPPFYHPQGLLFPKQAEAAVGWAAVGAFAADRLTPGGLAMPFGRWMQLLWAAITFYVLSSLVNFVLRILW